MSELSQFLPSIETPPCTNILIIEDSLSDAMIFLDGIERGLAGLNFKGIHACTLSEGMQIIQKGGISAVLLDFHLPDGEGVQALATIHKIDPQLPILVLTGHEDDDLGMEAVQHGAQDYLIKGAVSPTTLSRAIRYSIHRKKIETDLLTSREDALKSEDLQSTFLASMSHEIRTPLSSLLGFIQLAKDAMDNDEEREHYLKIAMNSGELLLGLVDDILEISAIKVGALRLNMTSFNLPDLVLSVLTMVEQRAKQKGVALKSHISPHAPQTFYCDARRLKQVLLNLVNNAIKFTSNGEITVLLEESRAAAEGYCAVRFVVRDTGIGISPQNIEKLFHLFEQTNKSVRTNFGGTGLGLYISQHLVEKLGGKITVRSQVDKGSEFEFTLRAPLFPIKKGETKGGESNAKLATAPLKLLLVEDTPELTLLTKKFLQREPYEILSVENGQKAVDAYKAGSFDLIIMDMQMPVMDGYDATSEIRNWEILNKKPKIPIIALTGNVMKDEIARCFQVGCDVHMAKPFQKNQLLQVIRQVTETDHHAGL